MPGHATEADFDLVKTAAKSVVRLGQELDEPAIKANARAITRAVLETPDVLARMEAPDVHG